MRRAIEPGTAAVFFEDHLAGEGLTLLSVPAPPRSPEVLLGAAHCLDAKVAREITEGVVSSLAWIPPRGEALVGLGTARLVSGRLRSNELRREAAALLSSITAVGPSSLPPVVPRLAGGFAFAPGSADAHPWEGFGDGLLVLPRWSYGRADGHAWLSFAFEGPLSAEERGAATDELAALLELLERAPVGGVESTPASGRRLESTPVPAEAAATDEAASIAASAASPADGRNDPGAAEGWRSQVEQILGAIEAGELTKVVAAHRSELDFGAAPDSPKVLEILGRNYHNCKRFHISTGGASFLGATPERLVGVEGTKVETEALAGTARAGEETSLDRPKNRREHALVVEDITARLTPLCDELEIGETRYLHLRDVSHLRTPIEARAIKGAGALELAAALHPTPAVGGVPRQAALRWISEREPAARGWYAGPFGWIDADGNGEFAVALRCGLFRANRSWVYAGAGIVRGSDPPAELAEMEIKMDPVRRAVREALSANAAAVGT